MRRRIRTSDVSPLSLVDVVGLVGRPCSITLHAPERGRSSSGRVPLFDVLAVARLDAAAEVLVAYSRDERGRALPLADVMSEPDARIEWSRRSPSLLVVPRWVSAADRFEVVALEATTYADFLREPHVRERSEG